MFINKDLLDFFASMAEIKKQKRDVFNTLAKEVDDLDVRERLLQISRNEQQHVDQLLQSMELVNGTPPAPPIQTPTPVQLEPFGNAEPIHNSTGEGDGSTSKKILEPAPDVEQHTPDVEQHTPDIEQHTPDIEQHTPDIEQYTPDIEQYTPNIEMYVPFNQNATEAVLSIESEKGKIQDSISEPKPDISTRIIPEKSDITSIEKPLATPISQHIGYHIELAQRQAQYNDPISHLQPTSMQPFYSMNTSKHPLAEVFGFTTTDLSPKAQRYRSHRHCPFNNRVPNCTKEHPKNPLGVCSILHNNKPVITCPVRFREEWLITDDAASFFFEEGVRWSSLTEVQLTDAYGKSAGDVDVVLIAYDDAGKMVDFGAIEIQATSINGDARDPFDFYMKNPKENSLMDWSAQSNYPQPDYVSTIRESLVPQLIFKGSILNSWNKKMAIAIDRSYFEVLQNLVPVQKEEAEIAWFIYDLELVANGEKEHYELRRGNVVYTKFQHTLAALSASYPDNLDHFMKLLPELADR